MCLYISTDYHPRNKAGMQKPITLKNPLQVWKILSKERNWTTNKIEYTAPYRGTRYDFGKMFSLSKDAIQQYFHKNGRDDGVVDTGLHAMVGSRRNARENFGEWRGQDESACFPALIPAGARVYLGNEYDHDIASTHLIVFKDMKSLLEYSGVNALAPPIKRADLARYNQ